MFDNYLYEIIGGVLLLIVLAIYIILKRKSDETSKEDEEFLANSNLNSSLEEKEDIETQSEDSELIVDEYDTVLGGSEEGDFGEEENRKEEEKEKLNKTIKKRAIPNHGKITKQNFTEFNGTRILVAEDNLINQKVLTGLLAGSGIEIVIANDGQEALDILEEDSDFLMILMDAHMPRVDGFEATRIIRKNLDYDHILVVALSGDTAVDDIAKMKKAGMAEQLEKPLRMAALYDIFYAYSGEKKEQSDSSEYIEVFMTKDLNGDKGLEICGGDEEFYKEILNEFISTYSDSTQELGDLLQNGQLKEADKVLLDIIGITANIGADPLNEIAHEIKVALSDTEEKSYLTLIDQYKIHLENLIKDVKNYK